MSAGVPSSTQFANCSIFIRRIGRLQRSSGRLGPFGGGHPMHDGQNGSAVDKVTPPLYDETIFSSPEIVDGQRVILHAERLQPVSRRVQGQRAIITRRVVSVRKTIELDILHEELVVEYVDGDGSIMLDEGGETIVVMLRQEEIEIVKHVRPSEEVRISKRRAMEKQRLTDTVRHEKLDII